MKILSPNKFLRIKRYLRKHSIREAAKESWIGYSESLISRVSCAKDYAAYLAYREKVNAQVRGKRSKKVIGKVAKNTVLNALTISDIEFMNAVKTVIKYIKHMR
jgi:hypothetical protein